SCSSSSPKTNFTRLRLALFVGGRSCAEKAWGQWFEQAQQSGIAALQKFAQRLQGYWHGIVARCRHPLNTSVVEGINNTIKVIKRRAYGYRDEQYFFLKIRAAFPGIPR
ncbi:transposase, partial [Burkholderia mallei]